MNRAVAHFCFVLNESKLKRSEHRVHGTIGQSAVEGRWGSWQLDAYA